MAMPLNLVLRSMINIYADCNHSRCSASSYEETMPTITSPGDVDFTGVFGPDDTSQVELQTLQDARSKNSWNTAASEMLQPYDVRLMRSYPVSTRINQTANDYEECAKLVDLELFPQGQLFR